MKILKINYRKHKQLIIVCSALFFLFAIFFYRFFYKKIVPNFDQPIGTSQVAAVTGTEKPADVLLGRAQLSYAGGTEGRNKNIELGIERINGTVVAPGAEFSYTKTLGEITEEAGFSKEKMFLNGEVTKGVGGGLCQISSTLFQSVLRAGLPVTERHNHSYSVSYYDVGLDATYADPGPDLKFVNDTLYPVTIKGSILDHIVTLELYGVSDGRVASTSEADIIRIVDFPPTKTVYVTALEKDQAECINKPQIGYTAKIIHNVIFPDGQIKEQIFTSIYKPLQRVCRVVRN
ncbi:MAG: VanW family protein [Candidatus Zambryskibacteria bacterium]|nr:VanW family protein [Candidatus Zambryskibacteria bacterium]